MLEHKDMTILNLHAKSVWNTERGIWLRADDSVGQ